MKTFDSYLTEREITDSKEYSAVMNMIGLLEYIDNDYNDILTEGILDNIGLSAHKGDGGLLAVVKKAGVLLAKFLSASVKGDKDTIKEIANTEITKEDFIDFLLKLDQATLHLLTSPIHFIEAVTGWHVWANVKKQAEGNTSIVINKISDATNYIKKRVEALSDKTAKIIKKHAERIEALSVGVVQ